MCRQSGLEMFGGPPFMMRVWPKPPRILRNRHWPSADVKALSVIGLCSCLGRWGGCFSENMMISQYLFNNWTTKMTCTVAKHGNMSTNNQNRWGRKHCMHIRKTESLRRPATFEPLDKHMISAGTNFRFASFVQQELQLQFEFLTWTCSHVEVLNIERVWTGHVSVYSSVKSICLPVLGS